MGSERPLGGPSLHKREGRERRRGHGVADAVSDGPIPLPPRLRFFDVSFANRCFNIPNINKNPRPFGPGAFIVKR